MASNATTYKNVGGGSKHIYGQIQLAPSGQLSPPGCTITPPESLTGGLKDRRIEDVLSDRQSEEGEILRINEDLEGEEQEYKDVQLLEEMPPPPTTESVQMVHVCPNKVTKCEGGATQRAPKSPPMSSQMFLKGIMSYMFFRMADHTVDMVLLVGADGGVGIHKAIIASYSKLVKEQLNEFPDCSMIHMPNYSQKILQKVVALLYNGETFYTEAEKKDVNLIWEAMRQLQITFNDKSFFCHPVEYTAVKEEDEQEGTQQQQQGTTSTTLAATSPPVEVDQTDETWYAVPAGSENAFSICRVIHQPHPENPTKDVCIYSKYGEGRRIQRSLPALAHINEEEIREREREANRKEAELILLKNKDIIIEISDDEDDDQNGNPIPSKKKRIEVPSSMTVHNSEDFKELVESGKIDRNELSKQLAAHGGKQKQLAIVRQPFATNSQQQHQPVYHCVEPSPIGVVIPPNRPEGCRITILGSPKGRTDFQQNSSASTPPVSPLQMPTLQAVTDNQPASPNRTLRARRISNDITDIPRLDRMNEDNPGNATEIARCSGSELPSVTPAAIIPVNKLNQFQRNQPVPKSSVATSTKDNEPVPSTSQQASGRILRKRKPKPLIFQGEMGISQEEVLKLREEYQKQQLQLQQQKKKNEIVVASFKKPVPADVAVDTYVENLEDEDVDLQSIAGQVNPSVLSAIGAQKPKNVGKVTASASAASGSRPRPSTAAKRGKNARGTGSRPKSTVAEDAEDGSPRLARRGGRGGQRVGGRGR